VLAVCLYSDLVRREFEKDDLCEEQCLPRHTLKGRCPKTFLFAAAEELEAC
jgi:hypothetical protein